MTRFAMFGFPRCGSTYLCSLLDSHPRILCHYEVFHPDEIVTVLGFNEEVEEMRGFTTQRRDENPEELIKLLYKHDRGAEAVGFKIFIGHSEKAHDILIEDREIKKILLRRSSIPAYVSMLIAEKTGAFTHKEQVGSQQAKVSLDMGGLLNFHRILEQYFANIKRRLDESGQRYLEVRYEELVSDPQVLDSLFEFLDVGRGDHSISAFTRKQNKASLTDKIDNIDEVVAEAMNFYFEQERLIKRYDADVAKLEQMVRERDAMLREREERIALLSGMTENCRGVVAAGP